MAMRLQKLTDICAYLILIIPLSFIAMQAISGNIAETENNFVFSRH
jgi:hypothetical protein